MSLGAVNIQTPLETSYSSLTYQYTHVSYGAVWIADQIWMYSMIYIRFSYVFKASAILVVGIHAKNPMLPRIHQKTVCYES